MRGTPLSTHAHASTNLTVLLHILLYIGTPYKKITKELEAYVVRTDLAAFTF
jgi:hypothetical protein